MAGAAIRYLLFCEIVAATTASVVPAFERLFSECGLPSALRMDNGRPFASIGDGRLTRSAVTSVKLGIRLERIDPGRPDQNRRHERMHRTLKAETSRPPVDDAAEQQCRFDAFRRESVGMLASTAE